MISGTFKAAGPFHIYEVRQKCLIRRLLGEDIVELCTHVLPALHVVFPGGCTPGFPWLHEGEALAPEEGRSEVLLQKLKQLEPDYRHDTDGEVHRGRLRPGDMPPARRDVEPIPYG